MMPWWKPDQAARALGVHLGTVYRWCKVGRLRAREHNGKILVAPVGHWFTCASLAAASGYTRQWIWRMIDGHRLRARRPGRRYMIPAEEGQSLISARVIGRCKSLSIRGIQKDQKRT